MEDCCNVLHFTNFLTVHQKNLNQMYIINGILSDSYEGYSKVVVAYLRTTFTCKHVTITILKCI